MRKTTIALALWLMCAQLQGQQMVIIGQETNAEGPVSITGTVTDAQSGEPMVGANLFIQEREEGISVDDQAKFALRLPKGIYTFRITYIGYETQLFRADIRGDGNLYVKLVSRINALEEVVVASNDPRQNITKINMGVTQLSVKTIETLPPFAGEVDILKSLVLLPGVSSVGEASSGFNIRGGGSDQNLIQLGGAPIYNVSHLFGYFSAFNSDVIRNVTIYKGGIPAKFGGRASSIIDLEYQKGDLNKWTGSLSLGTITSQGSVGGPLLKNKLSILLSGRGSYANWILKSMKNPDIRNSSAGFYDASAALNFEISPKNSLSYFIYQSGDRFSLLGENEFSWQNQIQNLTWSSALSEKFFLQLAFSKSLYDFAVEERKLLDSFRYGSDISDLQGKLELNFSLSAANNIALGVTGKILKITPGYIEGLEEESGVDPMELESEHGRETAFFLQHELELNKKLGLSYGARLNIFSYLGPKTVYEYEAFLPRSPVNIIGQKTYRDQESITQYRGIEPRFSLRYSINENTSVKIGYNRMIQNIGLISNTTSIAPTDIWKLADSHIEPTRASQYSIGLFKNLFENNFEVSLEAYYKSMENIIEYKDGANLFLNANIETELLSGEGRAYGAELYVKKNQGKMTGWVSYTYSRSLRRVIGFYPEETINNGEWYASNFDKPHDLTAVAEYKKSQHLRFSSIFTYSTGQPVSYPVAKFTYQGQTLAYYQARNEFRIPDYHRLDLSMTFSFPSNVKWLKGDWTLSVYNVYGRKNAFSVFFDDVPGESPQAYRLATLGIPFPSLSYKVKL